MRQRPSLPRALYELFSSMRFAIGLLSILAIASVIGTVLKQNQPYADYAFAFGGWWFRVFATLGLFDVYHTGWFLAILAFLMLSTALCIVRNAPGFWHELRTYRLQTSENSLAAMQYSTVLDGELTTEDAVRLLQQHGYRLRQTPWPRGATLIAAKKGSASRLGYFFAHAAILLICLGGLIDGNLPLKVKEWTGLIVPETRDIPQAQIPAHSRLPASNLSFRGDVTLAENKSADVVFIDSGPGYLVQTLPFIVTLKRFQVDYYSNGMPKLFASDILLTDKASGKQTHATVAVNHPLIVNGIAIYQASFGDGGSGLTFKGWNLAAPGQAPLKLEARSRSSQPLNANGQTYQLELGDLRLYNVEDMGNNASPTDLPLIRRLQAMRSITQPRTMRNIGPSISYKIRDSQGQAHEYLHYMAPIQQEGASYLISAARQTIDQPFQYFKLPLDGTLSLDRFMRLRATLTDPSAYRILAERSATQAIAAGAISPAMRQDFELSVQWLLQQFSKGGFDSLQQFLLKQVPADKRDEVSQTYLKILQGVIGVAMALADQRAGLPAMRQDSAHRQFLLDSLVAIGDLSHYAAPLYLQLEAIEPVQASGLQITRSPGKQLVYPGALLLIIGIVLMFYLQQKRLWLVLTPTHTRIAMSSHRQHAALQQTFTSLVAQIKQQMKGSDGHASD